MQEIQVNISDPFSAYIIGDSGISAFGRTGRERLAIQLSKLGIPISETTQEATLLLSGKYVYGVSILSALTRSTQEVVLLDSHGRPAAIRTAKNDAPEMAKYLAQEEMPPNAASKSGLELAGSYDFKLRKQASPIVMRMEDVCDVEQVLFKDSYKGVTDLVTKFVWPVPALHVTRWCARQGITPNQVTSLSALLVLVTFWCFWSGYFLTGLAFGWLMTFLDTVDGKLARVTLTSTRFGGIYDHGIDLIHPPFWWWAWIVGCSTIDQTFDDTGLILQVIVIGYIAQRVVERVFKKYFKMHIHVWRRFDSRFRLIITRRNPNLVILTIFTLFGAPIEGILAVAIWVVVSLVIQLIRLAQAFHHGNKKELQSWLMTT